MDLYPKHGPKSQLRGSPFPSLVRACSAGSVFEGSLARVGSLLAPV